MAIGPSAAMAARSGAIAGSKVRVGIGQGRLQRLRVERPRVPGGGFEGRGDRRVAAQRGGAGKPAQGTGDVIGGG